MPIDKPSDPELGASGPPFQPSDRSGTVGGPVGLKSTGDGRRPTLMENVLRHFKDAVIVLGPDSSIAFFNQAAEELTRTPRVKVLGRLCGDVFPETPVLHEMFERVQSSRQSETRGEEKLAAHRRHVPVRITCLPIWNEVGELDGAALVIQDISRQKALEETARQNENLAQLGTLVAGLAHEVRNPLAGIKGAAQLLAQKLPDDLHLTEYTDIISSETDRLSALVGNLLHLGAPPKPTLARINIHEVLQRVLAVLASEIQKHRISLHCAFDPSLPDILADSSQLQQVFLNLINNAIEAMTAMPIPGEQLSIRTKMESDYYVMRTNGGAQSYLRVEIDDSGPGIDPDAIHHIFEPFYTTKSTGTGLGLAIAQRIVADHQGSIRASVREPSGTSIWVSLPIQKV